MNNKLIGKSLALLLGVFAAQALFAADYSDYVSLRGTGLDAIAAFMTNVVDTTKGWSDELDPHDDADYVVAGNSRLGTPVDSTTSTCYEFPGKSLSIYSTFNGNRGLQVFTYGMASVRFKDLYLDRGVIDPGSGSQTYTFKGNLHLRATNAAEPFRIRGGSAGIHWRFEDGTFDALAGSVLETAVDSPAKGIDYTIADDMDASDFLGTFRMYSNKTLILECPRFGGCAEAVSNGTIRIAANGLSIAKVSLAEKDAELNFSSGDFAVGVDRLELTPDTIVKLTGSNVLTVGDLVATGGTLSMEGASVLAITNSISVTKKIALAIPTEFTGTRVLVTLPEAKGVLRTSQFACSDVCRLLVVVEDGVQKLTVKNVFPLGMSYTKYQASDLYIHQEKGGYSGTAPTNVFADKDAWSDTDVPHRGADYEAVRKGFWGSDDVDFKGDSLTYSGYPMRSTGANMSYSFPDLRVISGTSANYWPTFYCTAAKPNVTMTGMMTIGCRATDDYRLRISPCNKGNATYGVYNMAMKIVGNEGSGFTLRDYNSSTEVGAVTNIVKFTGDLSEWEGTVDLQANARMWLGGVATDVPGKVSLEDASSVLKLDGVSVRLGSLVTTAAAAIEIPQGKTLTVTDTLSLAADTKISAAVADAAVIDASSADVSVEGTISFSIAGKVAGGSVRNLFLVRDAATAVAVKDALRLTFDRTFSGTSLDVVQVGTAFAVQLKREKSGLVFLFR